MQYQNLMSCNFLRRYVSQHTILNEALWWYRDIPDLKIIFSSCRESAYFADLRKTCINIIRLFSVKFFPLKLQLISQYLSWRWHSHSHTHTHTHTPLPMWCFISHHALLHLTLWHSPEAQDIFVDFSGQKKIRHIKVYPNKYILVFTTQWRLWFHLHCFTRN